MLTQLVVVPLVEQSLSRARQIGSPPRLISGRLSAGAVPGRGAMTEEKAKGRSVSRALVVSTGGQ